MTRSSSQVCIPATRLEGSLELAGAVEVDRPFPRADALTHRARTLLQLFHQSEAFRLPTPSFFALFWEAARAAGLVAQLRQPGLEVTEVPVSIEQVVESLRALTPEAAPAYWKIHREYLKGAEGEASEALRYIRWAADYAMHLEDLLFPSGEGAPRPLPPLRTEMTISVMIVTRNRESLLGLALKSLVNQERPPDQVVVVDNASSDGTFQLALLFCPAVAFDSGQRGDRWASPLPGTPASGIAPVTWWRSWTTTAWPGSAG